MGSAAVGRAPGGTELGVGPGHHLYAQALGAADPVSTTSRSAVGFQHCGAGSEEGDFTSQGCDVLQDTQWRTRGRPVHEPDPYVRILWRQSVRLYDRVATARRRTGAES